MRRAGKIAALALGALLTATACGGDGDGAAGGGDTTPGTETSASGETQYADLSGETVEVAGVWTGAEQESFRQVLDAFEEATGATVKFTSTGDDIATVIGTRIEGGSPPDVAFLPQPGLLTQFAQDGALTEVSDEVSSLVEANYAPVWKELGTVDGKLYGVWFKAANKSTVWYRTEAFEQAGVEPPEDWDGFLDVAQTISDSGVTPVSIGGGDGWTLTDWFENVYLRVAGPEKYDQLAAHDIPWTDDSVKQSLSTLAELWGKKDLIVGGPTGALQTPFPESVTQVFSDNPEGAIVYEGDFVAGVISAETSAKVGEDAQFFSFPAVDGSAPSVVGGGDVAVAMTDNEGAMEMLKFLATPESAEIWAAIGGFTSPNKQVDTSIYPDEISQQIADALVSAETFRFDLSDQTPSEFGGTPAQGMWKILQDFLASPDNVDKTAQDLESAAAAAYK